jgi:hypothetical protein
MLGGLARGRNRLCLAVVWPVVANADPIAPAYLVVAACGVSLFTAVLLNPETLNKPLGAGDASQPASADQR